MGKYIVKFSCTHCGHCCRDVICLPTPWDVVRLARERGADPWRFLEFVTPDEISKVTKSDPTWLRCNGTRYLMALRRTSKGCYFLNKRTLRCQAYESRPLICRLYPFALNETHGGKLKGYSLQRDVECPRRRDGTKEVTEIHEMYLEDKDHQDDYEDLVKFFNSRPRRQPWDFLKLFIHKT